MYKITAITLVPLLLFVSGCQLIGLAPKPPEAAMNAAIAAIPSPEVWKEQVGFVPEMKDSKVTDYALLSLDRADAANGVTESWCITVSTLIDMGSGWSDMPSVYRMDKTGDAWIKTEWYQGHANCSAFKTLK